MHRTTFITLLSTLVALSCGQLTILPACTLDCATSALSGDGCALFDMQCHCTKAALFQSSLGTCVRSACTEADQNKFVQVVENTCGNATAALNSLISAVQGTTTTTASPAPTAEAETSAIDPSRSLGSLSPSVAAGIGAGAAGGGVLIFVLGFLLWRQRKPSQTSEQLQQGSHLGSQPGSQPGSAYGDTAIMLANKLPIDPSMDKGTSDILANSPTLQRLPSLRKNDPLPPYPPLTQHKIVELPTKRQTQRYELDGREINYDIEDIEKGSLDGRALSDFDRSDLTPSNYERSGYSPSDYGSLRKQFQY